MKRTLAIILATLAAAAVFVGLVYAVLVAAHVSEPAATTVYGPTPRRLWATAAVVLAAVGVVIGGLALARSASRFGSGSGELGAIVALVSGLIAGVNGGLNLCCRQRRSWHRQRSCRWRSGVRAGTDRSVARRTGSDALPPNCLGAEANDVSSTSAMSNPAESFEPYRRRLLGLAYRMLGSMADAEDAVQETYLRWHATDRNRVSDPRAFLMTTTTRICLDMLTSVRARHEQYVGPWLPEPVLDTETLASDRGTELAEDMEQSPTRRTVLASQAAVGQTGFVYYFSTFLKSLGDLDTLAAAPPLRQLMGEEGFAKYQKSGMEDILGGEVTVSRILPELSNPPEGIANADPAFWRPAAKTPASKPAKAKTPAFAPFWS